MKFWKAACAVSMIGLAMPALAASSLPVGTCINTGNALESGGEAAWGGKPLRADDFKAIRAAGFQTVRIPVNWYKHSSATAPHTIDPAWLKLVETRVDEALAVGLNVIVNSHYFEPVTKTPDTGKHHLAAVWGQIASRFKDRPNTRLWFEIENEPHDQLNNANLLATLTPALAAIRKSNPTRPVIIGGQDWSSVNSLETLKLPDDSNVYPTFHYYEPFDFTHQGAEWAGNPPLGRIYGNDADKARLVKDVEKVRAYITRTGKIPFMGENGAYDIIPLDQRITYHQVISDAFRPIGVGICMWGYANTFPFFDNETRTWKPGMLEAIGLKTPK